VRYHHALKSTSDGRTRNSAREPVAKAALTASAGDVTIRRKSKPIITMIVALASSTISQEYTWACAMKHREVVAIHAAYIRLLEGFSRIR
jgi:hypothetical protein